VPKATLGDVLVYLRKICATQEARDTSDGDLLESFVASGDQAAFSVLMQRHGPMVYGVCKRVLSDLHAAEDAFQATFMVLVRRASAIGKRQHLGGWLHAVAQRISLKARAQAAARRDKERREASMATTDVLDEVTWRELRTILDEEIGQLPEKYRVPIVLCYLEGKTQEQAAKELGWPKTTVKRRVGRARELLHKQLVRHGINLTAGALAMALGEKALASPVPAMLAINTVKAATTIAAGKAMAAGCVSARAAALTEEALRGMLGIKGKLVLLVLVCSLAAGGAGVAARRVLEEAPYVERAPTAEKFIVAAQKQENEAEKLFRAMEKKLVNAKSLKVTWDLQGEFGGGDEPGEPIPIKFKGVCNIAAGDKARAECDGDLAGKAHKILVVSDGVDLAERQTDEARERPKATPEGFNKNGSAVLARVGAFMTTCWLGHGDATEEKLPVSDFKFGAKETVGKTETQVIEYSVSLDGNQNLFMKLWINTKTTLPVKRQSRPDGKKAGTMVEIYTEFALDSRMEAKLFQLPDADDDAEPPVKSKLLDKSKPVPAGKLDRFGDPLPEGALARLGTVRFRPGIISLAVAFSPDGKVLASGGGRAFGLSLWDAESGRPLHQVLPNIQCAAIAFSPDGKSLLLGEELRYTSGDARVRLMDVATGKQLRRFKTPDGIRAWCVAFSPDGKIVAAAQQESEPAKGSAEIILWDAANGNELRRLKGHGDGVASIAFSPDGKALASGSLDKTVRIWDVATGDETRRLQGHELAVNAVAYSPNGNLLASAEHGVIRLWDAATGKLVSTLHGSWPLAFSADGKRLASGGPKANIFLWDAKTGTKLRNWAADTILIRSLAFSPDGKVLASAGFNNAVRRWDTGSGRELQKDVVHNSQVSALRFTLDGKELFSFAGGEELLRWNLETGKSGRLLFGVRSQDQRRWSAQAISLDGKIIAAGGVAGSALPPKPDLKPDPVVRLWNTDAGKELLAVNVDSELIGTLNFSPDQKLLAAGAKDKVYLWNASTGRQVSRLTGGRYNSPLAFSPDGKLLALEGGRNSIRLWDVSTSKERRHWDSHQSALTGLEFSPDGKLLASVGMLDPEPGFGGTYLRLWAVDTGKDVSLPFFADASIESRVVHLAFSPSGRVLATTASEPPFNEKTGNVEAGCTICLWDLLNGKQIAAINTPQETVESLAFSPNGRTLASGGGDSTILLWDMTGLSKDTNSKQTQLTAAELDSLWNDLGGDAAKADRAIWILARAPKQSVPQLSERLRPVAPADSRQVAKLVADLDSQKFAVRQQAAKELLELGERAEAALRKALEGTPNLEVRQRLEQILEKRNDAAELNRRLRAIETLEHAGTPAAQQLMELFAKEASNPRVKQAAAAALERVARSK
jgi:RNA polymerase sigma factor (sigma-70 family)